MHIVILPEPGSGRRENEYASDVDICICVPDDKEDIVDGLRWSRAAHRIKDKPHNPQVHILYTFRNLLMEALGYNILPMVRKSLQWLWIVKDDFLIPCWIDKILTS